MDKLFPDSVERICWGNREFVIPKCNILFNKWKGEAFSNTLGGKCLIDIDGAPMFAELAVVRLFLKSGWNARWIEVYGTSTQRPLMLKDWKDDKLRNQENIPINELKIKELLQNISVLNGNSFSGCWDVLAWKDDSIIFAELKRRKNDRLRKTQMLWFENALKVGLNEDNFLLVEWDLI